MYEELIVTFRVKSPDKDVPDLVRNVKFPLKKLKSAGIPFSDALEPYAKEFWEAAVYMGMLDV
jgi:hypothetical protein